MTKEISDFEKTFPKLTTRDINESKWNALSTSIYPGAKFESILMVIDYCIANDLNPLLKPVHIVPMSVRDAATGKYNFVDTVMPGIALYRIQAARAGDYAGSDEPEFGPLKTIDGVEYPEWCKYTVYKIVQGVRCAFTAKELWLENYATKNNKTTTPNAMWGKRSHGQIAKCYDEETEVLTTNGFELFSKVTGDILQATDNGLQAVKAKPFSQDYDGEMICSDGRMLNFCVTPNHDMLTSEGRIEAGELYRQANTKQNKLYINRNISNLRTPCDIDNTQLILAGYFLVFGVMVDAENFTLTVNSARRINVVNELIKSLHNKTVLDIKTKNVGSVYSTKCGDKYLGSGTYIYRFKYSYIKDIISNCKSLVLTSFFNLSKKQSELFINSVIELGGKTVNHGSSIISRLPIGSRQLKSFEVAAIHAGLSVGAKYNPDDKYNPYKVSIPVRNESPVLKQSTPKNPMPSGLKITINKTNKVWCVTVPSGVIVVRRNGYSMQCGNCTEAQALRRGWPELCSQNTVDEMVGKTIDAPEKVINPVADTVTYYPEESFNKNLPQWVESIKSGRATVNKIIDFISERATLTKVQIDIIKNINVESDDENT